jgi:RNA polymerase sigma factor (sigma-70 family)
MRSDARMDVEALRAGKPVAQETLYRRFHQRILAYLSAFVVDYDTLWDLTHDVFVKAFEAGARFEGEPAAVVPWLLAIARNTAYDHLRSTRRVATEEPRVLDRWRERDAPEARPEWGDDLAVHHAVGGLPDQQREVLVLHYCDGCDATEIGQALGKSADAVRHIEQRALTTIRRQVVRAPG